MVIWVGRCFFVCTQKQFVSIMYETEEGVGSADLNSSRYNKPIKQEQEQQHFSTLESGDFYTR